MPARAITSLALIAILGGPLQSAQSLTPATASVPKFDAVAIKPCQDPRIRQLPGDSYPPRGTSTPGHLRTGCYPLLDDHGMGLIRAAYTDDPFISISGGPSWIHSAFYEIDAVADGDPSVKTMMGPMMQALLEDRFHLNIHPQSGEGPVYLLTVARGGPKLHPFAEGTCIPYSTPPPPLQPGQQYCKRMIRALSPASIDAHGVTLDDFSRLLLGVLDRPVLNRTNLPGRFDIHVDFALEGTKLFVIALPPSPDADPSPPSIFTAVQEQLGLKLDPGKGPTEILVIDRVEKPSED